MTIYGLLFEDSFKNRASVKRKILYVLIAHIYIVMLRPYCRMFALKDKVYYKRFITGECLSDALHSSR